MIYGISCSPSSFLIALAIRLQCKPDISRSCISRNRIYRGRMLDPIFLATHFVNFADMTSQNSISFHWQQPLYEFWLICKSAIFREFAVIPWTPFAKSAHRGCLWSGSQETIFREICSGPIWLTCEMRAGTHAVRWPATEGGSLTPPLYHRVGSY